MQNKVAIHALRLMFEEAKHTVPPSRERLQTLLRIDRTTLERALLDLERAGLVNARCARLTLPGLAVAASMARGCGSGRSLAA